MVTLWVSCGVTGSTVGSSSVTGETSIVADRADNVAILVVSTCAIAFVTAIIQQSIGCSRAIRALGTDVVAGCTTIVALNAIGQVCSCVIACRTL